MDRIPNSQSISWFLDLRKMGRLNLNPEYQRYSVWNIKYRQFFIDTIIRNYPCPTIFLVKEYDPKSIEASYGVVDGKQRLTTIFGFIDGDFSTDCYDAEPHISEKYFNDLQGDTKRNIFDYQITVEVLNNTTNHEIKEAFDRMNRNVAKLNAQELRHAKYSGRFINFCETWTENPWFQSSAVCTQRRTDRMSDVEFISELIVLTDRGIQNGKDILDLVYSDYDDDIPNESLLYANFEAILSIIKELGLSNSSRDPLGKLVDIYSLWAAIREIVINGQKINIDESRVSLENLATGITNQSSDDGRVYYINAQRQTNSLASRKKRADIIMKRLVVIG